MSGDVTPYTGLITSEHQGAPKFMATIAASLQPLADMIATLNAMPAAFDLDQAVGAQLDAIGVRVGVSRQLAEPLTGVYFSFDTPGLGFDQGTIQGPFDPTTGLVALPDDNYRTVLRARISANSWDGTVPSAYQIWDLVFQPQGVGILIQDNSDMTMMLALTGSLPNAVTLALFSDGLIDLKPAGVQVSARLVPSVANAPYFGFDIESSGIAGFDVGAIGTPL